MQTKTLHGVTLWAVPRFHRSTITPANTETAQRDAGRDAGTEWANRPQTYSFALGQDNETQPPNLPDVPGTCH